MKRLVSISKLTSVATVPKEFLERVQRNNEFNRVIVKYYERLYREEKLDPLINKTLNMYLCQKYLVVDVYKQAKIKDILHTNNCRDRFCNNCKKVVQAIRMSKYVPVLKQCSDKLFHLVLTQPNCTSEELVSVVKKMSACFRTLIRILRGTDLKIKDLDISDFGYEGALRSLEITYKYDYKTKSDTYHPHYHVALVLSEPLGEKYIKNKYSRNSKSDKVRLFSDKEVLIQKIWHLLCNDVPVTKKNIEKLELGYSCSIDKFADDDYIELFKYIAKSTSESEKIITYNQFKTLYFALHSKKQIQGYGVLYRIKNDVSEADIQEASNLYDELILYLQKKESPETKIHDLADLIKDSQYTLISRKRIYKDLINAIMSD